MTLKGKKHLFIWALLALALFCVYFFCTITDANKNTFQEKWYEKKLEIDMVCGEVDYLSQKNKDWGKYDYRDLISSFIVRLHDQKGTQASVFDSDLNLLTRTENHPVLLMAYKELLDAVTENDSGELTIEAAPPYVSEQEDYWVYYRWIPIDPQTPDRLLLVVIMSENAVLNPTDEWVIWGAVALILAVFVYVTATLVLLTASDTKNIKEG